MTHARANKSGTVLQSAKRLRESGHEFIFTTREHPDTIPLAKILGEKPIVVGKYNPIHAYFKA